MLFAPKLLDFEIYISLLHLNFLERPYTNLFYMNFEKVDVNTYISFSYSVCHTAFMFKTNFHSSSNKKASKQAKTTY